MHPWHSRFWVAFTVLWLVVPATCTTECSFTQWNNFTYPSNYTGYQQNNYTSPMPITSQEDLNTKSAGCSTIVGHLHIASNYSGPLVLHSITNITGHISSLGNGESQSMNQLLSIEMPDLVVVSGIILTGRQSIALVSFPKLESSNESIIIYPGAVAANLSFPALVNSTDIIITGNTSALNFNSVRNITGSLEIYSSSTGSWSTWLDTLPHKYSPPRDISLPALQSCGSISLAGNISRIELPMLETVTADEIVWNYSGFNVGNYGKILNVTAPALSNVTVVRLLGIIGTFSFPSLIHLDGDFILSTTSPLNVSIAPLETAGNILLTGNITGYDLSSLKGVKYELQIQSTLTTFNCSPAQNIWGNLSRNVTITKNGSPYVNEELLCSGTTVYKYTSPKKSMSAIEKSNIGIGVGMSVLILLSILAFYHMKRQIAKKKPLPPPAYEHEFQGTIRRLSEDIDGDVLPGYQPRGAPVHEMVNDGIVTTNHAANDPPRYDIHVQEGASTRDGEGELVQRTTTSSRMS